MSSITVVFAEYLQRLAESEAQREPQYRRPVPTIMDLIVRIRSRYPDSKLHPTTLHDLFNNRRDRVTLDIVGKVMDEMYYLGFHTEVSDFFQYVPPGDTPKSY